MIGSKLQDAFEEPLIHGGKMVSAEAVTRVYRRLSAAGISTWVLGGWGIDALLGEQTREHKDLDLIMLLDDVARARQLLAEDGYVLSYLWEENLFATDANGTETASAFVLNNAEGVELDIHAMRLDESGNGIPAWEAEGFVFPKTELAGTGMIEGFVLQCITPEMQVRCHMDYVVPEKQLRDLDLLQAKFGVRYQDRVKRNDKS